MDTALDGLESPPISERPNALPEEVRVHLDGCPACRGQWQLLSRAEAALRVPRIVPAPAGMLAEFRDRLAAETRHAERRPVNPFSRWLWPMGSLAAAGMAAAFMIATNLSGNFAAAPRTQPSAVNSASKPEESMELWAQPDDSMRKPGPRGPATNVVVRPERERNSKLKAPIPDQVASAKTGAAAPPVSKSNLQFGRTGPALPRLEALQEAELRDLPLRQMAKNDSLDAPKLETGSQAPLAAKKTGAEAKSAREPRDSFLKRTNQARKAMTADPLQGVPAGAAGDEGAAGGFGGGGLGGGVMAGIPAGAAAKGDLSPRGIQEQSVDRLLLVAERESLIAAEVSPALVTALQRPVTVEQRGPESVLTVLGRLSREADIEVQLEGKVSQLSLSLQTQVAQKKDEQLRRRGESQVPLWVALQSVAQQGKLQVVPEDNRLVLRPLDPKAIKALPKQAMTRQALRPDLKEKQEVRLQMAPIAPAKPAAPAGPPAAKPAPANEPRMAFGVPAQQQNAYFFAYDALPNPDPRVWPAMWGDLPKWLFTLPEERPEKTPAAESK